MKVASFFYHIQLFESYFGSPSVSTENLRIQNNSEGLDFFGHGDDRYDHLWFMRDIFMKYGHWLEGRTKLSHQDDNRNLEKKGLIFGLERPFWGENKIIKLPIYGRRFYLPR